MDLASLIIGAIGGALTTIGLVVGVFSFRHQKQLEKLQYSPVVNYGGCSHVDAATTRISIVVENRADFPFKICKIKGENIRFKFYRLAPKGFFDISEIGAVSHDDFSSECNVDLLIPAKDSPNKSSKLAIWLLANRRDSRHDKRISIIFREAITGKTFETSTQIITT